MDIFKLKEVLEELGIEEILDTSFKDQIRIIRWDLEKELFLFDSKKGFAWYVIEGGLISIRYLTRGKDMLWEIKKGEWFGITDAVLNDTPRHDVKILKGTVILEIPLEKLMNSQEVSRDFYRKILEELAKAVKPILEIAATKINYGDEMYFIEYLKRNDYEISFKSIKDLAELLNINLRTFHRILKKMVSEKILLKEINSIKVIDFQALESYIQELSEK